MENQTIGISTFNCNGLANTAKRNKICTWLTEKRDIQIVCLQENELKWKSEWRGDIFFSHGVMILFKKNVDYILHSFIKDNEGRWIVMDLTINNVHIF